MRHHAQTGLILPALLIVLLFGALAFAVTRYQQTMSIQTRQHLVTVRQLAKARTVLQDFAQSFHLTHPNQTVGYLPCPDLDNDGSSDPPCGGAGELAIGRFPYRTLGVLPMRDGHGECLWYVVSGQFKDNPKAPGPFNWDTPGQFTSDGRDLQVIERPTDYAAALLIAPGAPLSGQNRTPPGDTCNGVDDAGLAKAAFLEGSYPNSSAVPLVSIQGTPDSATNNDQIAWLTAGEILGTQLQRRSDFKALIDGMLDQIEAQAIVAGVIEPPANATVIGAVAEGEIPTVTETPINDRWREHFRFLRCESSAGCMTLVSPTGLYTPCSAIVLFAGAALPNQTRSASVSDENYFEGNMAALADPEYTLFFGASQFVFSTAAQDLIRCLP